MREKFEKLMTAIFDDNFVVWLTVLFVLAMNIFGNAEPIKFIKFCATMGFMYAAFAYMEVRRIRKELHERE